MARKCTLKNRDLVCSMITISESAAPKTLLAMDPQCNCEKQDVPGFFIPQQEWPATHQHDQCKCQSITKRYIFKLVFNILTHHLVTDIP